MSAALIFIVFWAIVIAVGVAMVAQDVRDRRRDDEFYRRWQSRRRSFADRYGLIAAEETLPPGAKEPKPNVPKLRKVA